MTFSQCLSQQMRGFAGIKPGVTLLAGVSGGVDSMVLLHALYTLRHQLGVRIIAAHYDHRLRASSGRDQRMVAAFSRSLNVPLLSGKRSTASGGKVSEDRARTWRFNFFARAMAQTRADFLVLAHHQNDLAETVLMRVIRGSGLEGIRAIQPQSAVRGIQVLRPLLEITRARIEDYARRHHVPFCHDPTNFQDIYLRNKVRRHLLPLLAAEYNPRIVTALARLAQTAADDHAFIQASTLARLKENIVITPRSVRIKLSFLKRQPAAIVRAAIRQAYRKTSAGMDTMSFDHVQSAQRLAGQGRPGEAVDWPEGIILRRTLTEIEFRR